GPFESGRQSPGSLGGMLLFAIFLQIFVFCLVYVVIGPETTYPYNNIVLQLHLIITVIMIMLSIVFGVSSVFKDFKKTQYYITILVSQNMFGWYFYIAALFMIGTSDISTKSMLTFTAVTLLIGLFVFIITFIRFYILLRKGKYRSGSGREFLRNKLEKKSLIP